MVRLKAFINRLKAIFWLPVEFKRLRLRTEILKRETDLLLSVSNRKVRRKWRRMLLNPRSPFYVGNIP